MIEQPMDILQECFPSHRQEMTRFREALAVAEAQEAYKLTDQVEEGQKLRLEGKQIDGTAADGPALNMSAQIEIAVLTEVKSKAVAGA